MSSNIVLHPILNHFLASFKERPCVPSGLLAGNMDRFSIGASLTLKGGYIVCTAAIKFAVSDFIHCTGPGGGLIAGKQVELEAPDITLVSDESDPVQVVALENLSLKATDMKIQNVVFYLLNDANLSMNASIFSRVKNVRVVRLKMDNQTPIQEVVAYWKDSDALAAFMNHQAPSPQQEDRLPETMEMFLERLSWEREAVKKIGLRSILA